jgi:hypothetical protein
MGSILLRHDTILHCQMGQRRKARRAGRRKSRTKTSTLNAETALRSGPRSGPERVPYAVGPDVMPDLIQWARAHSHYKHLPASGTPHALVPQVDKNGVVCWTIQPLHAPVPKTLPKTRRLNVLQTILEKHLVTLNCFISGACRPGDEKSNTRLVVYSRRLWRRVVAIYPRTVPRLVRVAARTRVLGPVRNARTSSIV